jgi:hypothetical protein
VLVLVLVLVLAFVHWEFGRETTRSVHGVNEGVAF